MMSEDVVKEQLSYFRSCDLGDCGDEVDLLAESVYDDKDQVMALLGDQEVDDEVHRDLFPVVFQGSNRFGSSSIEL